MIPRLGACAAVAAFGLSLLTAGAATAQACGQFPMGISTSNLVRLRNAAGATIAPNPYHTNSGMGFGGVSVGPDGELYSASQLGQVRKGPTGALFATVPGFPQATAFDADGNLLVTESQLGRVIKVTPGGVQSTVVTTNTVLMGIALDRVGNMYVAVYSDNAVRAYRPDGSPLTTWGVAGVRTGFQQPVGLAFDATGALYVGEESGGRVSRISPDGMTSSLYVSFGPASLVQGLAFDDAGNLFVSHDNIVDKIDAATFTPGSTAPAAGISNYTMGATVSMAFSRLCNAPERQAAPVPTLSEWAMILFGLILAGSAALHIQRRRNAAI